MVNVDLIHRLQKDDTPRKVIVGIADETKSLNIISTALERILLRCWTNAEAVAVLGVYPNQSYNSFERLPPPMPISISSIVCSGSFLFLKNLFPGPLRMRLNLRRFSLLHGTMQTEHVLDMIFCSLEGLLKKCHHFQGEAFDFY